MIKIVAGCLLMFQIIPASNTGIAIHPLDLGVSTFQGFVWFDVTGEIQLTNSVSLLITPVYYKRSYTTKSELFFGGESTTKHENKHKGIYLGSRYYFPINMIYVQSLFKYDFLEFSAQPEYQTGEENQKEEVFGGLLYIGKMWRKNQLSVSIDGGFGKVFIRNKFYDPGIRNSNLIPSFLNHVLIDVNLRFGLHP